MKKLPPRNAYCAVCGKPGRTSFSFDELLNPDFKYEQNMSQISGFQRKDGSWPFGKVVKYVHQGSCHKTFTENKSKYREEVSDGQA